MSRRQLGPATPSFDVAGAVDLLRQLLWRTDALVHATELQFERFTWSGGRPKEGSDDRGLEHLAHLLGAAKEAARAAVTTGDELAADLVKHQSGA